MRDVTMMVRDGAVLRRDGRLADGLFVRSCVR